MISGMMQANSSFYAKLSEKNLLVSASRYNNINVSTEHCNAYHDDKMHFLRNRSL